jgi:uncharacterized membrane protein
LQPAVLREARRRAVKVVQFVTLMLFSLVTGVFWGTWFSLSRSMVSLTTPTFLEVGHTMIGNLGGPMSVLMPSAVLSGIIVCTVLFRRGHTRSGGLALVSMLLLLSAMAITLTVNVPIDRRIQTWTTVTVPSDWMATRDRWEYYHGLRTLISVLAFACLLWSTLETTDVAASDHAARPGGAS